MLRSELFLCLRVFAFGHLRFCHQAGGYLSIDIDEHIQFLFFWFGDYFDFTLKNEIRKIDDVAADI